MRIARALSSRVEDVFALPDEPVECPVELAAPARSGRIAVARVRDRTVAWPVESLGDFQAGFAPADGFVPDGDRSRARLFAAPDAIDGTAFVLGCDPSLGILRGRSFLGPSSPRVAWLPASSQGALDAVACGTGHVAGLHFSGASAGDPNLEAARRALGATGGLLVAYAEWEQGLMVAAGNPKRLRDAADLARRGVRLVDREEGSASRRLLDELLDAAGVPRAAIRRVAPEARGHVEAARAVTHGAADAGVGLRAVARAFGLDFVPLAPARFDLAVPRDLATHPAVAAMLDAMQTRAFRRELETFAGYSTARTGSVVAEFGE